MQNFVVFCQTSTSINHRYTQGPFLLKLPPISLPMPSFWIVTGALFEFPGSYSKFPLAVYFTYGIISFHVTLHTSHPLPRPLPRVHRLVLYVFLHCCPENEFINTLFLDAIYESVYNIYISLSDLLRSI